MMSLTGLLKSSLAAHDAPRDSVFPRRSETRSVSAHSSVQTESTLRSGSLATVVRPATARRAPARRRSPRSAGSTRCRADRPRTDEVGQLAGGPSRPGSDSCSVRSPVLRRRVHRGWHDHGAKVAEQGPQRIFERQRVPSGAPGGPDQHRLAGQHLGLQHVEERLEQAGVRAGEDRRDHDQRVGGRSPARSAATAARRGSRSAGGWSARGRTPAARRSRPRPT